jgi:curved DNA-binding protein CbpA
MNLEQAEKSMEIAKKAMDVMDYEKAIKFIRKSINLHPTEEAQRLLFECKAQQERQEKSQKPETSENSKNSNSNHNNNNNNNSSTSANHNSNSNPLEKNYTAESERKCREILRRENYYDILGVSREATEDQIKRAYKKLALKFHPDKNHAPQATEAFKKVAKAFSCLSNEEKRKIYDEHGTEDYQQRFSHEEFNPDDLFEAFFGAHFFGMQQHHQNLNNRNNTYRVYRREPRAHFQPNDTQRREASRYWLYLQFLPFLLVILLSVVFNFSSWGGEEAFALERTPKFSITKHTEELKVKYFVEKTFSFENQGKKRDMFERDVEVAHINALSRKCRFHQQERAEYEWNLQRTRNKKRQQYYETLIRRVDLSECDEYQELKNSFFDVYGHF